MMAGKANPSALLLSWHLQEAFEVVIHEAGKPGARPRTKRHGQAQNMRITEKGKVENKTDQLLMLLTTTTQDAKEAPYALQFAKLTWSGLRPDAVKKGLPNKPTPMQVASSLVSTSVVSFGVLCLQGKSRPSTTSG
jgi:hypothetical protein